MESLARMILPIAFTSLVSAQTAEELVAKNLQAKGGVSEIKSIKTLRISGRMQAGSFTAEIGRVAVAPDLIRTMFTVQGMTEIQAYDGSTGWQISPFEGRKDPELLGEDSLRGLVEEADFYGPLDYEAKGNTIESLGHDTVDGDDAFRLKVTLKNGDVIYYYLDPDTFLEIRTEKLQFIRGSVRETFRNLGSYKRVGGVYFPFSIESGTKQNPGEVSKITIEKIEANVPAPASEFKMPTGPPAPSGRKEL